MFVVPEGTARLALPTGPPGKALAAGLPVNKSQPVKKRRPERFFFTLGEKFTSHEQFTGKAAFSRGG
jgi:hypothetical protein